MDEKMKDTVIKELEKLGFEKDQIDDYLIWGAKKLMLGVMKIKWSMMENGIEGAEADEKLKKIVDKVISIDAKHLHEMMHKDHDKDWSKKEKE